MLLGLLVLNCEKCRLFVYPFFYVAILVKCLCGYEYISTIMMSGIMFLILEFVQNKEKRKDVLKAIISIGVLSILAFMTAYVIHASMYGAGDIVRGLKMMQINLVERRTYGAAADFPSGYTDSLNASALAVLWKYIGFGNYHGVPMFFLLVTTLAVLAYRRRGMGKDCRFEASLFVITLLSAISWIVLAKSHSYVHTHMNYVVFYMGWVQVCIYIIVKTFMDSKGYVIKKENNENFSI